MFLHHPGENRGDQPRQPIGGGEHDRAPGRIAFVRHGRGFPAGFGRLTDLLLHEERYIARDLSERARIHAARSCERRQAVAVRMPRGVGQRQVQFARERSRYIRTRGAESGERA